MENPYPALKELRAAGEPVWHEGLQMFLAARHADANDVFRNKSLGRIFKEKTPEFEWEIGHSSSGIRRSRTYDAIDLLG